MKKKSVLSLLISAIMMLTPVISVGAVAANSADNLKSAVETSSNTIVKLTEATTEKTTDKTTQEANAAVLSSGVLEPSSTAATENSENSNLSLSTLPESYDARNDNIITSVKNQGRDGTCWAHAVISALETAMIKNGVTNDANIDLSEHHVVFFSHNSVVDPLGGTEGDYIYDNNVASMLGDGGTPGATINALCAWAGPVLETKYSYDDDIGKIKRDVDAAYGDRAAILTEAVYLPYQDIDAMKQAIVDYGSLAISFYYSNSSTYFNSSTSSRYCDTMLKANHSITIVGWDDNFSKDDFGTIKPQNNGAWLIKNSHGTYTGDNGYFWLSYEDATLSRAWGLKVAKPDTYDNNYQYDGFSDRSKDEIISASTIDAANIFTVHANDGKQEQLKAVQFSSAYPETKYSIQIYKNITDPNDPTSGTAMLQTPITGTEMYIGKYTVDLPTPITLNQNETFSVVVTLSRFNKNDDAAIEAETGASSKAGQSFYRRNGGEWVDKGADGKGNLRIKAFTKNTNIPTNTDISTLHKVTVQTEGSGNATATPDSAAKDTEITLNATPSDGYTFKGWTVVSGNVTINDNKFTMPDSDVTVKAIFEANTPAPTEVAVQGVSLQSGELVLTADSGSKMTVTVSPANATNKNVAWSSSDTSVVSVDASGNLKAYKEGTAVITVTTEDGSHTATRTVRVNGFTVPTGLKATSLSNSAINLNWNAVSGATKYYVYRATSSSGSYTSVGTVTGTSFTNSGLSANTTYYYKVRAYKTYDGKDIYSNDSVAVSAKTAANPVLSSVTVPASANKGQTITITANTTGYSTGVQYRFTWSNGGKSGVIKEYSTSNTAAYKLENSDQYTFQVYAKLTNGTVQTKTALTNSVPYAFSVTSITVPTIANAGQTVTVKANTSGNTSGLQYKFVWSMNNWSQWGVIRDFSTSNTASLSLSSAGTYEIYVDVKGKDGTIITKTARITVGNPSNFNVTKVNVPSTGVVGNTINISATATGNTYGLQYKFVWNKDNWNQWGVIRDFGTSNTTSFKLPVQGNITFYVDVKATNGKVITKSAVCNVKSNYSIQSVSAPSSAKVGQTVTIKPNMTGETSGLQYKFVWGKDNWNQWGVIKDFSTTNTVSMFLTSPGKYEFYIDVKGPDGTVTTKSVATTASLNGDATSIGVSSTSVKLGSTVTLTGNTSGTTSSLQYKFLWCKNNWEQWGVIREFAAGKTVTYRPTSTGTHVIYMDAKDQYGNIKTITRIITVY